MSLEVIFEDCLYRQIVRREHAANHPVQILCLLPRTDGKPEPARAAAAA
jgi:hypothetical protein